MPFSSTTVTPQGAYAGMLGDASDSRVESFVSEEASAEIPFGVAVKGGTDPTTQALKLTAITDMIAGIVLHSHAYHKDKDLGSTGLKPKAMMGVATRGLVWVPVEEAVTPASATVFVRAVATGNEVAGAFRDTADSTDCINITQCARFRSSTSGAGLALLEFDFTGFKADEAGGGD